MSAIRAEPQAALGNFYEELERLLEQLAARQRLFMGSAGKLVPPDLKGETVEALAVLAVQRRLATRSGY